MTLALLRGVKNPWFTRRECLESLYTIDDTKRAINSVIRRKADNILVNRKRTNNEVQHITLNRKLKIDQHQPQ